MSFLKGEKGGREKSLLTSCPDLIEMPFFFFFLSFFGLMYSSSKGQNPGLMQ